MRIQFITVIAALLGAAVSAGGVGRQERAVPDDVRIHRGFASKILPKSRDIMVWLPPGYASDAGRRYPVLYLHDGANVLVVWRIDETAKPLITSGEIEPLIIVLVPNGGTAEDRFEDYTPTRPPKAPAGGKADLYGRMLIEELKPFIDSEYRTLADGANTGLGGASLGGLVSLYLGLKYPGVFGKLAIMSPSVWWDDRLILRNVRNLESRPSTRIWLAIGTKEPGRSVRDVRELRDALLRKGWTLKSDLIYLESDGDSHDDESFGRRAAAMLKHLFPASQ